MPLTLGKWLIFISIFISLSVSAKVEYLININQPEHHLADVSMTIPKGETQLNVFLPTWRTGNYLIINQANGIRDFKAYGDGGSELSWTRIDKSHWQIANPSGEKVNLTYQVYANELARRSRHIDSTHAYLDATAVLMYEKTMMQKVHLVKLKVPQGWKSFSGMTATGAHEFVAQSYHQLASSPIETGINQLFEFDSQGKHYQLVIWGEGNYNAQKMADDLQKLVSQSQTIWSGYPYQKYVFIVHATSGASGATEHLNSTVIQRHRLSFAPRKDYLKFLRTASHELIHTWNVKAYRPSELVPYNYQSENYTELFWVAEGSTSYFQDRLLLTAKLQTVKEFLDKLALRIHDFERRPGAKVQSIADASFEKWIAQGGDFAENHSVNIYSEGYMTSWLLDFQMLKDTQNKVSYRDIHKALYDELSAKADSYKQYLAIGFNQQDILSLAKKLTKKDYSSWWKKYVLQPAQPDFESLLERVGIQFAELKPSDYKPWAGFELKDYRGFLSLKRVERNGPAWQAGLTINDQIVALNGLKVTPKNWDEILEKYQAGNSVKLTIFRNDMLAQKTLELASLPKTERKLELVKNPSESQKQAFKAWLGIEFPLESVSAK
ncbi:M61 family metallopeptidase [Aliikangiella sp. IMCC44632]